MSRDKKDIEGIFSIRLREGDCAILCENYKSLMRALLPVPVLR